MIKLYCVQSLKISIVIEDIRSLQTSEAWQKQTDLLRMFLTLHFFQRMYIFRVFPENVLGSTHGYLFWVFC